MGIGENEKADKEVRARSTNGLAGREERREPRGGGWLGAWNGWTDAGAARSGPKANTDVDAWAGSDAGLPRWRKSSCREREGGADGEWRAGIGERLGER